MLKRRTSKRFILAESGEDGTWDPKTDTTNADQAPAGPIPTIAEPDVVKGTGEKSEAAAVAAAASAPHSPSLRNQVPQQRQNDNLLKVNTGGLTLK